MMQKFFGLISVLSLLVWKETNSLLQSMMVSPSLTAISQSSINSSEVIGWSTHLHNPTKNPPLHLVGKSGMGQSFEDEKSTIISAFLDEKLPDADDILPNKMTDKNLVTPLTKTFNETGSSTGNAQSNKIPFFPRVIRLQQLAFMPPAISRLFNTFTFKGIGVSISKSLVKWKSTAIGFKVPLTANFPIYDSIVALPKIGTSFSLRYPFDFAWSISLSVPVTAAVQGLVWAGWVMGQLPHHMLEQSRKAKAGGAIQRVGMTYALRFNPQKGVRSSYGPWLFYVPERKLLDKILPHLYMLPAIIMAFLDLVFGLHATKPQHSFAGALDSAVFNVTSADVGVSVVSTNSSKECEADVIECDHKLGDCEMPLSGHHSPSSRAENKSGEVKGKAAKKAIHGTSTHKRHHNSTAAEYHATSDILSTANTSHSHPSHPHHKGKRKDHASSARKSHVRTTHNGGFDPRAWQAEILAWTRAERRNVNLGGRIGLFKMNGVVMPSASMTMDCQPFFPFKDAIVAGLERLRNQRNLENAAAMLTMAFQSISKKKAMNSTATQQKRQQQQQQRDDAIDISDNQSKTQMKTRMQARYRQTTEEEDRNWLLLNLHSMSSWRVPGVRDSKSHSQSHSHSHTRSGHSHTHSYSHSYSHTHSTAQAAGPQHFSAAERFHQEHLPASRHVADHDIEGHEGQQANPHSMHHHGPISRRHGPRHRHLKRKMKKKNIDNISSTDSHNVSYWHMPWNRNASSNGRPSTLGVDESEAMRTMLIIAHRHAQLRQLHKSPSERRQLGSLQAPPLLLVSENVTNKHPLNYTHGRTIQNIRNRNESVRTGRNYSNVSNFRTPTSGNINMTQKLKHRTQKHSSLSPHANRPAPDGYHLRRQRHQDVQEGAMQAVLQAVISHRHAQFRQLHKPPAGRFESGILRAGVLLDSDSAVLLPLEHASSFRNVSAHNETEHNNELDTVDNRPARRHVYIKLQKRHHKPGQQQHQQQHEQPARRRGRVGTRWR